MISGRLSRLDAAGAETVLIEDFCQQYPSHSVGTIDFGPDGMLYVSAGDGASFTFADYGQEGSPVNPCGDPPGGDAHAPRAPRAARCVRRASAAPATQAATLNGAILRVDPDTGDAAPGNPAIGDPDLNRRRIVAYGFRNPFRFTFRPGTGEIWSGDVGWNSDEEINRTPDVTQVRNYGWPCYEGSGRMGSYDSLNLTSCETLYSEGERDRAVLLLQALGQGRAGGELHDRLVVDLRAGLLHRRRLRPAYKDALFFSDYSRNCIWVMYRGANGLPDPATRETFLADATGPVFLTQGPDGALYYADLSGGTIRRIAANNRTPTAHIVANPASGDAPLTVAFDGRGSSDPENQPLSYAWDLDGDGAYDDSTVAAPSFTYPTARVVTVRLRVRDPGGLQATASMTVTVGGAADRDDRRPVRRGDVGRRRHDQLLRVRDHRRRCGAARGAADLGAAPAALLARGRERLPHARDPGLRRRVLRAFRRARPRVPVPPRAVADRDRRRRPAHDQDDAAEPEDVEGDAGERTVRPAALVRE